MPDPSAERETGDAGRTDDPSGCDEAKGLSRGVKIEPRRATRGHGGTQLSVNGDPAHRRKIDHQPAVTDAVAGRIMPAATYGHFESLRPCEVEGRDDVAVVQAANDHRRQAVDEKIEATSGLVVPGVRGNEHGAGQRLPQLSYRLIDLRGLGHASTSL